MARRFYPVQKKAAKKVTKPSQFSSRSPPQRCEQHADFFIDFLGAADRVGDFVSEQLTETTPHPPHRHLHAALAEIELRRHRRVGRLGTVAGEIRLQRLEKL